MKKRMKISRIKIPDSFKSHPPKESKMKDKVYNMWIHGFDILPPIVVDTDYNLIDGYCTYLIAKQSGFKKLECQYRRLEDLGKHRFAR
jgi:hypothetical protein